jgi:hypothetical protein
MSFGENNMENLTRKRRYIRKERKQEEKQTENSKFEG